MEGYVEVDADVVVYRKHELVVVVFPAVDMIIIKFVKLGVHIAPNRIINAR